MEPLRERAELDMSIGWALYQRADWHEIEASGERIPILLADGAFGIWTTKYFVHEGVRFEAFQVAGEPNERWIRRDCVYYADRLKLGDRKL